MEVYLVRHADAVPLHERGITSDADRPLSQLGEREMKRVAAGLSKVADPPDLILTSPLLRAYQTAEIVRQALGLPEDALREEENLSSGASPKKIMGLLRSLTEDRVMLVGHEPDFSRFLSWLVSGHTEGNVAMKKGGVARIDIDKDQFKLMWLLPPKITKALAK